MLPGYHGSRPWLVQGVRDGERKRRNHGIEALAVGRDHLIASLHRPDRRFQGAEARILEGPTRLQYGLLADDTLSFDALHLAVGIGDDPLARDELRDIGAAIRDADVILEQIRSFPWRT